MSHETSAHPISHTGPQSNVVRKPPSPSENSACSASTTGAKPGEVASSSTDGSGAMRSDTSWAGTTSSTRTAIEAPSRSGSRIRAITGPAIAGSGLSPSSSVAGCAPNGCLFVDAISRIQARQSHMRHPTGASSASRAVHRRPGVGSLPATFPLPLSRPERGLTSLQREMVPAPHPARAFPPSPELRHTAGGPDRRR